jgi:UDP-N-acetyl-D-mannosaminuronic acid transferase (WecB/TagA/CpsF family)
MNTEMAQALPLLPACRILGVDFVTGTLEEILDRVEQYGGLVVLPSGPGMRSLENDPEYRAALLGADYALPDSGFMVLVWNLLFHPKIAKLSGYQYLSRILDRAELKGKSATFWVMPSEESSRRNLDYLAQKNIFPGSDSVYIAPKYDRPYRDSVLLEKLEALRPRHIFLAVGGGVQEPLG